jgi:hypothetical protein
MVLRLYYKKAVGIIDCHIEEGMKRIASVTEYYTSADLQSLIYNSFLIAVKSNISLNKDEPPIIICDDIELAYKDFKRSMSI